MPQMMHEISHQLTASSGQLHFFCLYLSNFIVWYVNEAPNGSFATSRSCSKRHLSPTSFHLAVFIAVDPIRQIREVTAAAKAAVLCLEVSGAATKKSSGERFAGETSAD